MKTTRLISVACAAIDLGIGLAFILNGDAFFGSLLIVLGLFIWFLPESVLVFGKLKLSKVICSVLSGMFLGMGIMFCITLRIGTGILCFVGTVFLFLIPNILEVLNAYYNQSVQSKTGKE